MIDVSMMKTISKKSRSAFGKPHPKSQFSADDDKKLISIVDKVGDQDWELVSQMMETRNPRQCKERYMKYLSPNLNKSAWTNEEDLLLISKYKEIGPKWVKISKFFDNRTDAALKNRWNILLRRQKAAESMNQKTQIISNANSSSDEYEVKRKTRKTKAKAHKPKQAKVGLVTSMKTNQLPVRKINESLSIPNDSIFFDVLDDDRDSYDFFNSLSQQWPLI